MEAVPVARQLSLAGHGRIPWQAEERRGPADVLHAADLLAAPVRRRLVWMDVDAPALVLGSAQPASTVDAEACARHGVALVRRRSGGGAVLVEPGEMCWLDVVVPADDPLADDDVGRATWWLGEVWASALAAIGVVGAEVHRGALITTPWSAAVCFAGLGAGEVTQNGAKLVGISQRRTRDGARFQCAIHLRWQPDRLLRLLAAPRPSVDELPPVAAVSLGVAELRAAVEAQLAAR